MDTKNYFVKTLVSFLIILSWLAKAFDLTESSVSYINIFDPNVVSKVTLVDKTHNDKGELELIAWIFNFEEALFIIINLDKMDCNRTSRAVANYYCNINVTQIATFTIFN